MKKNLQIISALSLAAVLTACGGGSSGGTGGTGSTATSLTGTASKGIIIGGTVTAYPLVNGVPDTGNALGTATTDANGEYTLELPADYDGSPILVSVTPASDNSTTMRCDIPSGCGTGVDFGADYDLVAGSGFSMSAILPEATAGQAITVNPTPLTEVAAQLALDAIANAPSATEFVIDDAIADANSATADRFGITGDLNEQPVIDITDPEAVAAATTDAIIYNSLAGAIVEATQDDDAALSIEEALESFVTDYVDNGGISGNTATAGTTSLEEILTAAQEVLTETGNQEGGDELDLTAVNTALTTDTAGAGGETPDVLDGGDASDTAADGELDQVKAMVADLRDIGAVVSLATISSADAFATEVELASIATEAGTASAMAALGEATVAVTEAITALGLNPALTSHTASNGILVTLASTGTLDSGVATVTASVDTVVNANGMDNDVDVTFTSNLNGTVTESGTEPPDQPEAGAPAANGTFTFDADIDLDFALTGLVGNDGVALSIGEGSVDASVTLVETEVWSQSNDGGVINIDEDETLAVTLSISFDLSGSLAQQTGATPITFAGSIGFSMQGITQDETESFLINANPGFLETFTSDQSFNTLDVYLNGGFSTTDQSFDASVALSATGNEVTFSEVGGSDQEDTTSNDESADNFVGLSVTLSFAASLTGISDPVSVDLTVSRSGLEEGTLDLDLAWEGNHLDFDFILGSFDGAVDGAVAGTGTIANQDGVLLALALDDQDVLSGTITNSGTQYATIDDDGVIHYVDGFFESL